jgi:uncharacterized membrane protein YdbT with pleckstrin-like domain
LKKKFIRAVTAGVLTLCVAIPVASAEEKPKTEMANKDLAIGGIVSGVGRLDWPPWIAWVALVLVLWPIQRHARNRLIRMTILDDKLRYEVGALNKTTRTILISRVQDLTVHQRVGQRIFGVGDLSIETAGETSRLTIPEIDRLQEIADRINQLSQKGPSKEQLK